MDIRNGALVIGRRWIVGGVLLAAGGCQTYTAQPLSLEQYVSTFDARRISDDSLQEFADELRQSAGHDGAAFEVSDGLSASEAEIVALFFNAAIRVQRLEAGVARVEADYAGLWNDPTLSIDGTELLSPDGPFEFGVMLELTIPISGRLETEKSSFRAMEEVERRRLLDAEWKLRGAVRSHWIEWVVRRKSLKLAEEAMGSVDRIASVAAQLEDAGELSRVDARVVRAERAALRDALMAARAAEREQRQALLHLLGLPLNHDIALVEEFPTLNAGSIDGADTIRILEANTRVATQRAAYSASEAVVEHEIRKQFPDLNLGAGYGNEDDDRLLLGLSLPIPMVNANRGAIASARAQRDVARARAEAVVQDECSRLVMLRSRLESVTIRSTHYESEVLPLVRAQIEDVERLMSLGSVDSLLVLDAVDRARVAKERMLALHAETLRVQNALCELIGPEPTDAVGRGESK